MLEYTTTMDSSGKVMMARARTRREFIDGVRGVALATPLLSLVGCGDEPVDEVLSFGGGTMGTTYSVKLAGGAAGLDADVLRDEVQSLLDGVDRRMSTYRADSELSRFNAAEAGRWMPVSTDTFAVVERSRAVHGLTAGAFDPTVGPIVDLWGFGPGGGRDVVPPAEQIADAAVAVGLDRVESRDDEPAIRKQVAGVRLDLSGVAKGFAVDLVAEHIERAGAEDYLVEVGGELRAGGHGPGGRPWRVGIEKPTLAANDMQHVVHLGGEAMATSGNYRIFFERDGRRYSHIVNPRTGRPVEHDLASVTVLAPTTLEADALSTSLLVLGAEDGMALAAEHDIAAFFIRGGEGSFEETASPAFTRRRSA